MRNKPNLRLSYKSSIVFCILITLIFSACSRFGGGSQKLIETQAALSVQQTVAAISQNQNQQEQLPQQGADIEQEVQATMQAAIIKATIQAQEFAQPTLQPPLPQDTIPAVVAATQTQEAPPAPVSPNESPAAPAGTMTSYGTLDPNAPAPITDAAFSAWMKTSKILLYEDMAGIMGIERVARNALDKSKLKYQDAKGTGDLLNGIASRGPGGKGWDLIIAASEGRQAISGEFIPQIVSSINEGSSLVMEQWNLDAVSKGKIQELFMICEIEFQADFFSNGPMPGAIQAMQIIDGTSPIIHFPNDNIRISSITDYWTEKYMTWSWDVFDYGDLIQLPINSKSKIILGSKSGDDKKNGTLVSCLNNRVILWTSSTHNYAYNRILPLWQNMIYHALKARYDNLNPPAAQ